MAGVSVDGREPLGVQLGLEGQYGLDDAWSLRLATSGSRHGVSGNPAAPSPG
jgi:hypothetical protein